MARQNGEQDAKSILDYLISDLNITLPEINWDDPIWQLPVDENSPLFKNIPSVTLADLSDGCPTGEGVFDKLMTSAKQHLLMEYQAGRITAGDYTKAYISLVESVMQNATQFLLQKDQAFWQAQMAQLQAFAALVQTQTAKAEYAKVVLDAQTSGASYALTTMKLATEDQAYGTASYNLANILPAQWTLVKEQTEAQRAQTLDNRADGSVVSGSIGKQKQLYDQQITSYKRDAEVKAGRPFIDAWIAMKTIDEGLLPPNGFSNVSIDQVLTKLKTENGFS
ncbi:putative tail protein [Xanthomonas virus PB119]|nr:putative tail protein [Xanthomonas virus PB119]